MNNKLVSIIIPFFNRIKLVESALESAISQTYKNTEIILVNDGSKVCINSIKKIAESYKKIHLINNRRNFGVSYSRNIGMEFANGEYIAFLDSDDEWINKKIEIQVNYMESKNIDFLYTAYLQRNMFSKKLIKINIPKYYKYPYLAFQCNIATPTVIFKKDISQDIKFINKINYGEDIIFWSKISKKNKLHGLNIPTVIVNKSSQSSSKDLSKQREGFVNINKALFKKNSLISIIHYFYFNLNLIIKYFLYLIRIR